jgi:hypothetical protein
VGLKHFLKCVTIYPNEATDVKITLPSVIRGGIKGGIARHRGKGRQDDLESLLRHIAETQGLASSAVFGRCTADQGAYFSDCLCDIV